MGWSVKIARVAGTEIKIHITFLIFLLWIGFVYYQEGGPQAAIQGLVFILLLFLCVLLHELGHVVAPRSFGVIATRLPYSRATRIAARIGQGFAFLPVTDAMTRGVPVVQQDQSLEKAFQRMEECKCPALPVVDTWGRLVGIISPESVGEFADDSFRASQGTSPAWRNQAA